MQVELLTIEWSLCDRNEIASCEEAAYESLPIKDAATLLFFKSLSEVLDFAKQVRLSLYNTRINRPTSLVSRSSEVGRST